MNSFISWIGGKKLLRKKILEQFPEQGEVERYVEVFGGAGWVLFGKDSHAPLEVFNDANSELINLYRCVKYHPEALQKELDGLLMSRELFFDAIHPNEGLTDIQKSGQILHGDQGKLWIGQKVFWAEAEKPAKGRGLFKSGFRTAGQSSDRASGF